MSTPLDLHEWGMLSGSGSPPIPPGPPPPPDPSTITGLIAWFDPTTGLSLSGSLVDSWVSRFGPANTVSNTGAARPSYSASGLLSKPCVSFSGTTYLFGAATLAAAIDARAPFTAIVAHKLASVLSTKTPWSAGNSGAPLDSVRLQSNNTPRYSATFFGGGSQTTFASTAVASTNPATAALIYDGTNFTFRLDGVAYAGSTSTKSPVCNIFAIGCYYLSGTASLYHGGVIGDLTIYNSALSAANCAIVETYLRWKYPGLP